MSPPILAPAYRQNFTLEFGVKNQKFFIKVIKLGHLCFNITEKGHMIVPDWYNMILVYTRKYGD